MTAAMEQARGLMEQFKAQVQPSSELTYDGGDLSLLIPVVGEYEVLVFAFPRDAGLRIGFAAPALHTRVGSDGLARIGGTLVQVSNLITQIRALTGGQANAGSRSQVAVR